MNTKVIGEEILFRRAKLGCFAQTLEDAWARVSRTETRFAQFGGEIREMAMYAARQHLAAVLRDRRSSLGRIIWTANGRTYFSDLMEIGARDVLLRNPANGNEVWVAQEQVMQ